MKYNYIAAMALIGASSVAFAQQKEGIGAYVEAGYVHLNVDVGSGIDDDAGLGIVRAGYNIHENIALEVMGATGFSDAKKSGCVGGYCGSVKAKIDYAFGAYVKPKVKLGEAEIFARLGYTHAKVKTRASLSDGVDTVSYRDSGDDGDFSFGAGVSYSFTKQVYAQIDYMRYYDRKGVELSGPSISVGFKF